MIRIGILGATGTGRSSLLRRLVDEPFDHVRRRHEIQHRSIEVMVNTFKQRVELIDPSSDIDPGYLALLDAAFLVYDTREPFSLPTCLFYGHLLRDLNPYAPTFVIGTHSDQIRLRKVGFDSGRSLAEKVNAVGFEEVSLRHRESCVPFLQTLVLHTIHSVENRLDQQGLSILPPSLLERIANKISTTLGVYNFISLSKSLSKLLFEGGLKSLDARRLTPKLSSAELSVHISQLAELQAFQNIERLIFGVLPQIQGDFCSARVVLSLLDFFPKLKVFEVDGSPMTDSFIVELLKLLPALRKVSVTRSQKLEDLQLTEPHPSLIALDLSGSICLRTLVLCVELASQMRSLVLDGCVALRYSSLRPILHNASSLVELSCLDCTTLGRVFSRSTPVLSLQVYRLGKAMKLKSHDLDTLAQLTNLKRLDLCALPSVTTRVFEIIIGSLPKLEHISISGAGLSIAPACGTRWIARSVRICEFERCPMLEDGFISACVINWATSLESFVLRQCEGLHSPSFSMATKLKHLDLTANPNVDLSPVMQALPSSISSIVADGCTSVSGTVRIHQQSVASIFAALCDLENIELSCTNLNLLRLCGCRSLSSISIVAPLLHLEHIDLAHCASLTSSQIAQVFEMLPFVRYANLSFIPSLTAFELTSDTLAALELEGCAALSSLSLVCPNLGLLDLANCCALSDQHLINLSPAAVPALRELVLSGCSQLSSPLVFPNLTILHIQNCPGLTKPSVLKRTKARCPFARPFIE